MVNIILSNQKSNSTYKTAVLNLSTGQCVINNKKEIAINELMQFDFIHPLLTEPSLHSSTNLYQYSYNNFAELLLAPRLIYATLIHAKDPLNCQFDIFPSPSFFRLKAIYKLSFSLDYRKPAKEEITINQLNDIVSDFSKFQFQFQDKFIVKAQLSFSDLPNQIEGDLLYKTDEVIRELLDLADQVEPLELRYINHFIGFGVYARQAINKDEFVLFYCGMKNIEPKAMHYYFHPKTDALNMGVDAREYGNMARFINHAPSSDEESTTAANLIAIGYNVLGVEVIALFASRDIKKGEQLLFDYSKKYFRQMKLLKFNEKGNVVNSDNKELHDSNDQRIAMLRVFARHGVKHALFKLVNRFIIIALIIIVLGLFLNYSQLFN
ncbi:MULTISPECIES: SET domain-containing protein-lysine N-methyltransferase [Legionella]|uniref:SET domain protein n=1 Tax=Legionella maceachernii TaxID=466 RepID=A0A0W0VVT7_9GAMM|nr:SET domain-containing protein-lysine N-methyltransferase [Legionella maceachernii]KTD24175.1 SET domain protein [Legionella maceachernii]SJZ88171.1 SET domain-containing protein [Legionella maceachernii]SUO98810.1 Predicted restriction endonuclease [Legionella maceachernii]